MPCSSLFDEGSLFLHQPGKIAKNVNNKQIQFCEIYWDNLAYSARKRVFEFFLSIIYLVS